MRQNDWTYEEERISWFLKIADCNNNALQQKYILYLHIWLFLKIILVIFYAEHLY